MNTYPYMMSDKDLIELYKFLLYRGYTELGSEDEELKKIVTDQVRSRVTAVKFLMGDNE